MKEVKDVVRAEICVFKMMFPAERVREEKSLDSCFELCGHGVLRMNLKQIVEQFQQKCVLLSQSSKKEKKTENHHCINIM